jgi:hypothetical protein
VHEHLVLGPGVVVSTVPWVTHRTPLRELVEAKLGMDVCEWVAQRRKADPRIGWRPLAEELAELTGRRVAHMSLVNWCPQVDEDG